MLKFVSFLITLAVEANMMSSSHLPTGTWDFEDTSGNVVFEDVESNLLTIEFPHGEESKHTWHATPGSMYWDFISVRPDGTQWGGGGGFVILYDHPDIWWWYYYPTDDMDEPYASGPCVPK